MCRGQEGPRPWCWPICAVSIHSSFSAATASRSHVSTGRISDPSESNSCRWLHYKHSVCLTWCPGINNITVKSVMENEQLWDRTFWGWVGLDLLVSVLKEWRASHLPFQLLTPREKSVQSIYILHYFVRWKETHMDTGRTSQTLHRQWEQRRVSNPGPRDSCCSAAPNLPAVLPHGLSKETKYRKALMITAAFTVFPYTTGWSLLWATFPSTTSEWSSGTISTGSYWRALISSSGFASPAVRTPASTSMNFLHSRRSSVSAQFPTTRLLEV